MTDPISDFLTHLRNASKAGLAVCVSPHSKLKESLANILKNEGYVRDVATGTDERGHKTVIVTMKYVDSAPVITGLKRSSTPGRRLYTGYTEIPRVLNGLGIAKYKLPEYLQTVKELPMTPTGKVQKFKLRESAAQQA